MCSSVSVFYSPHLTIMYVALCIKPYLALRWPAEQPPVMTLSDEDISTSLLLHVVSNASSTEFYALPIDDNFSCYDEIKISCILHVARHMTTDLNFR